jgi:hypothetical protein
LRNWRRLRASPTPAQMPAMANRYCAKRPFSVVGHDQPSKIRSGRTGWAVQ